MSTADPQPPTTPTAPTTSAPGAHATASWWRRQRRGLLLLPLAMVVALLASSSRVHLFWWPSGPHDRVTGSVGAPVRFAQEWVDKAGTHQRKLTVTVGTPEQTTEHEGLTGGAVQVTPPNGSVLWRIPLTVEADPSVVLFGCKVALIDARGRTFTALDPGLKSGRALKTQQCVPAMQLGPRPVVYQGMSQDQDTLNRPKNYQTFAYVVTAADARPSTVRLWWDYPTVIEVSLTP